MFITFNSWNYEYRDKVSSSLGKRFWKQNTAKTWSLKSPFGNTRCSRWMKSTLCHLLAITAAENVAAYNSGSAKCSLTNDSQMQMQLYTLTLLISLCVFPLLIKRSSDCLFYTSDTLSRRLLLPFLLSWISFPHNCQIAWWTVWHVKWEDLAADPWTEPPRCERRRPRTAWAHIHTAHSSKSILFIRWNKACAANSVNQRQSLSIYMWLAELASL